MVKISKTSDILEQLIFFAKFECFAKVDFLLQKSLFLQKYVVLQKMTFFASFGMLAKVFKLE
jgi:hypothetical protein